MMEKMRVVFFVTLAISIQCISSTQIPASLAAVNSWFHDNVKPFEQRKSTLNATLAAAEANPLKITVKKNGKGDFTTITDAIKSVPLGNKRRVLIYIDPGVYTEKLKIVREKPFITLIGSSSSPTILTFNGTAKKYGTVYSATLEVDADFFMAINLTIKNSAPRPQGAESGGQALALRVGGDKAALYNCKLYGFQDTLCDDRGRHFFKDCFIEGTVDFVFGSGKSIYLTTELSVQAQPGMGMTVITAHARDTQAEDTGFSFVHCKVTGVGSGALLGRAWRPSPRVVFAYSTLTSVVNPTGWSDNFHPDRDRTVMFGEYQNDGPGAVMSKRASFTKKLTSSQVLPFLTLDFVQASTWLLPPPSKSSS